jgi:hypothetical protein
MSVFMRLQFLYFSIYTYMLNSLVIVQFDLYTDVVS